MNNENPQHNTEYMQQSLWSLYLSLEEFPGNSKSTNEEIKQQVLSSYSKKCPDVDTSILDPIWDSVYSVWDMRRKLNKDLYDYSKSELADIVNLNKEVREKIEIIVDAIALGNTQKIMSTWETENRRTTVNGKELSQFFEEGTHNNVSIVINDILYNPGTIIVEQSPDSSNTYITKVGHSNDSLVAV